MEDSSPRRPDFRRTLPILQEEWEACRACDLGVQREQVNGSFVFGEGSLGGVMFIGEGPGRDEEVEGRPFVGRSGQFLRDTIDVIGFKPYYITNTVCCRSWEYDYDPSGNVKIDFRTKGPRRKDAAPNKAQVIACSARLLEEIYLVDPVLIVTLGGSAAEALLGTAVTMTKDSGVLKVVEVPGASFRPMLTTTGRKWARWTGAKDNRQLVWPYEQNTVSYPLLPLYHPAHVMAHEADKRPGSPMHLFATGMKRAYDIFARYQQEVGGELIVESTVTEDDIYEAQSDAGTYYE